MAHACNPEACIDMADGDTFPLLALPIGKVEPPLPKPSGGGGQQGPSKQRQLERLEPQFAELRRVLDAQNARLAQSALGAGPEHVLVFETNEAPDEFYEVVKSNPDLEWLLDYEERVDADGDFKRLPRKKAKKAKKKARPVGAIPRINKYVYMVMFNQTAITQLLGNWETYKTTNRMPPGLGAWSAVFRCLRDIRRWGPEDRLREADLLQDALEPIDARRLIPVELELWPRADLKRRESERQIRQLVQACGGQVLDSKFLADIHYHGLLVELPHQFLTELLARRDVSLLQVDDIYLIRPTPQAQVHPEEPEEFDVASGSRDVPPGEPVVALLDGLPVENHPLLRGHLIVDDPDGWAATYQVKDRRHGTAMASLLVQGSPLQEQPQLPGTVYVRPILKAEPAGPNGIKEQAPHGRLWLDLIHEAVRRLVADDYPGGPVAAGIRIINLSVGDEGRQFVNEPSPLARLLDWLAWKHQVLFVVSAGNDPQSLPNECEDDCEWLRFSFGEQRHRRLLSPGESINALTVGALNVDAAPSTNPSPRSRAIPSRGDLPAAYSRVGRGFRRAVKPDVLAPGGRQIYQPKGYDALPRWVCLERQNSGHVVATPNLRSAVMVGTSAATVLTSRLAAQVGASVKQLAASATGGPIRGVSHALLVRALVVHSAEWPEEAFTFVKSALSDLVDASRAKDDLSGILGYGVVRPERGLSCTTTRATVVGGGAIAKDTVVRHRIPLPKTLHLHPGWRRLIVTLTWFSPINAGNRKYRVARLGLGVPSDKKSPLLVKPRQVHSDATVRGTVQHVVLDQSSGVMSVGPDDELDILVTCAEDGGTLHQPVPYALAVSLEVAPETRLPIYQQVAQRLSVQIPVPIPHR